MNVKIYSTLSEVAKCLLKEWLFFISLFLLLFSSFYLKRVPKFSEDEIKTLFTLWVFLSLLEALREERVFRFVVSRFLSGKYAIAKLVAAAGILSVFITNDVALFVTVPLTLLINSRFIGEAVILEALVVNGLSSISPIGNPQNIYIFYHYSPGIPDFVKTVFPLGVFVFFFVLLRAFFLKSETVERVRFKVGRGAPLFLALFLLFVLCAVGFLPLYLGVLVVAAVFFFHREALFKVDYFLLGTFFCFFGFTDNLSAYLKVGELSGQKLFWISAALSQFMSNVPSALLLSDFTSDWKSLLWGVSVGGFGTLVASMVNLIAYRLYVNGAEEPDRNFLLKFHIYGFAFFVLGALLYLILFR